MTPSVQKHMQPAVAAPSSDSPGATPPVAWYQKRAVRAAGALAGAVLLFGGGNLLRGRTVEVIHPERGPLVHKVVSAGRVMPPARIQLGSTMIGKVVRVAAEEGARVEAGQVLVELDDREQRAALTQAQAALFKAQARVGLVGRVTRRTAEASVEESRSAYAQAARHAERTRTLFASGSVPQQQVDDAERALDLASSRLRQAEIASESARPGGSDFSLTSAGVLEAEAAVQAARARLDQLRLAAPAEAVVLRRQVEPGDVVQPGRTLLLLARSGPVELTVQADEKNLSVLRVGQTAVASADALPQVPFEARVAFIAPAVDADRGTIEIRLSVPRPPAALRPDMTVSVNVEVDRRQAALSLDERALHDATSEHPWVWLVRQGRAERREVRIGLRGDGKVELLEGLAENEQAILPDGRTLAVGTRVRPVPPRAGHAL